jgi:hypothetical protein
VRVERLAFGHKLDTHSVMSLPSEAAKCLSYLQARQESNLQPPGFGDGVFLVRGRQPARGFWVLRPLYNPGA